MKAKRNKRITIRESELANLLDSEHLRGYNYGYAMGVNDGRGFQKYVDDSLLNERPTLRARLRMLDVVADGCEALARLAKRVS